MALCGQTVTNSLVNPKKIKSKTLQPKTCLLIPGLTLLPLALFQGDRIQHVLLTELQFKFLFCLPFCSYQPIKGSYLVTRKVIPFQRACPS